MKTSFKHAFGFLVNYTMNLHLDDRIIVTKHAKTQKGSRLSAKKGTYGRADGENKRGPVLEIRAEKDVRDESHEQENRSKSGAGS